MAQPALLEGTELAYATPSGVPLASGLTFELHPGQLLLITGPNGSGKSTLLKVLLRQFPLKRGLVRCTVPASRIALIPQLQNLEFHLPMTLRDVLEVSLPGKLDMDAISRIGLLTEKQLAVSWNTASGGERQRAMLTRALLQKPSLLFLDEPLNHLDQQSQKSLLDTLHRFVSVAGGEPHGIVLVSHAGVTEGRTERFDTVHIDLTKNPEGDA